MTWDDDDDDDDARYHHHRRHRHHHLHYLKSQYILMQQNIQHLSKFQLFSFLKLCAKLTYIAYNLS